MKPGTRACFGGDPGCRVMPLRGKDGNMRIRRTLLMVAVFAAFLLAASGIASAATVPVTGTITAGAPGTCSDFVLTGRIFSFHCDGLTETWAGGISGTGFFDVDVSINVVSGEILESGTETFVGCVGVNCGTLEWVYHGSGKFDLQTLEVIFIDGEQHFTGGTGDLADAHGSVTFSSVDSNPGTYEGSVVL